MSGKTVAIWHRGKGINRGGRDLSRVVGEDSKHKGDLEEEVGEKEDN